MGFRQLNANIVDDKFPMPRIEDLFVEIGTDNKCFMKIDIQVAYHHIPLLEECQSLTAIVTHLKKLCAR